jgi:hypothetical protein
VLGGLVQVDVPAQPPSARQTSVVVHPSPSSQLTPVLAVPAHLPLVHTSELVHAFPSSQAVPLPFAVYTQPPAPHAPADA